MGKIISLNRAKTLVDDEFSKESCHSIVYPDWHTRAMSYPTYYPEECLNSFDFEESNFRCKNCNNIHLYYRFDLAFETTSSIFLPNRVDLSFDVAKKKGPPCFMLVHILCVPFGDGCRTSWYLKGAQRMLDVITEELDEDWVKSITGKEVRN